MPFTPDCQLELLFASDCIPSEVKAALGDDLHMRPLAKTDHTRGHLSVLSVLTSTPPLTAQEYTSAFASLQACPNTYFTLVIVERASDTIVAVGTAFIEQKFTRGLGRVGHIEDIAVSGSIQGRGLGKRVIEGLVGVCRGAGCYKTILNCSEKNIPFYEKCGFEKREKEMAMYHGDAKPVVVEASIVPPPVQAPRL